MTASELYLTSCRFSNALMLNVLTNLDQRGQSFVPVKIVYLGMLVLDNIVHAILTTTLLITFQHFRFSAASLFGISEESNVRIICRKTENEKKQERTCKLKSLIKLPSKIAFYPAKCRIVDSILLNTMLFWQVSK